MTESRDETVPQLNIADLGNWLRRGRQLAAQFGRPGAVDAATQLFGRIDRPGIRLVVIGAYNSGETQLIARYLDVDVVPDSVLSIARELTFEGTEKGQDTVSVAGSTARPISDVSELFRPNSTDRDEATVRLGRATLTGPRLTVVKPAPLDTTKAEVRSLVADLLAAGDVLALVLDADTPLRRTEHEFFKECRRRGIPAVVVVAKADRIPPSERGEFDAYLVGKIGEPDLTPLVYFPDAEGGVGEFAAALDGTFEGLEPIPLRARQVAIELLEVLDDLLAIAMTARDRGTQAEYERAEALHSRQLAFEGTDLVWHEIQLGLQRRRQKIESTLREYLTANRQTIFDGLLYELERAPDIKAWWERDLPFRLQRELRSLAANLTNTVNRQIAADFQWIRDELRRRLEQPAPAIADSVLTVDAPLPTLEAQGVANTEVLKIVSRVGTGVAVVGAATLFATAGIGGIAIAASIGAGLLGEQLVRRRTSQDREVIREALGTVVVRTELNFADEVSRKLGEGYDRLLRDLKGQQVRWQQAQLRAIQDLAGHPADPTLASVAAAADEVQLLASEVRTATR